MWVAAIRPQKLSLLDKTILLKLVLHIWIAIVTHNLL